MRQLNIDGISTPTSKRMKPITCPVCIASKARRANRPASSTPEDRSTEPWQDVYTDLSGKIRTPSVTGALYFAVFVDGYTGSKHVKIPQIQKTLHLRLQTLHLLSRSFDPTKEPRFLTKNSLRIWNQITRITSCAPKMNTPASALPRIASESSVPKFSQSHDARRQHPKTPLAICHLTWSLPVVQICTITMSVRNQPKNS
jgi:hypothetical protein